VQTTLTVSTPGRGICSVLFLDDVPVVPPPKLSFIANDDNPIGVGLALSSTIDFNSLEFIVDCLGHLSISPQGWDSDTIFVGMAHNGSLSKRTALEESSGEDITTSGADGSLGSSGP
jgi:hypothetical protein